MTEIPTWQCVVAAALARNDGRYLMHRRPPTKQHGGLWEFPGGKVEPGESPGNALIRELNEELGVTIPGGTAYPAAFAQTPGSPEQIGIVILLYTVGEWIGQPRALEPGAEIGWWTRGEILTLARPPLDIELCKSLFAAKVELRDAAPPR